MVLIGADLDTTGGFWARQEISSPVASQEAGTYGVAAGLAPPALDGTEFPRMSELLENTPSGEGEAFLSPLDLSDPGDEEPSEALFGVPLRQPLAERASAERLALMVREYVNRGLTPEEGARLKVASERVERLLARVTAADFQYLEEGLRRSDKRRARLRSIRERLGT